MVKSLFAPSLCFQVSKLKENKNSRASDFFQDWWAKVTQGEKNGGSFSEMIGPSISKTVDIWVVYFTYTLTLTLVLTADYTVKPVLSGHSKKKTNYRLMQVKSIAFCNTFDLH